VNSTATIRLRFPVKKRLAAIYEALKPETRSSVTSRSKVTVQKDDRTMTLTLSFEAKDTSALRAALNSYLHWIRLTKDALEAMEPF